MTARATSGSSRIKRHLGDADGGKYRKQGAKYQAERKFFPAHSLRSGVMFWLFTPYVASRASGQKCRKMPQTPDQCRPGHHGYIVEATGRHWSVVRRSPRPPAPRAQAVVSRSSSRFFPGRHCDRNSSFHLKISRAPEAGAMPAYILKVLAPAAQSFIRHSH